MMEAMCILVCLIGILAVINSLVSGSDDDMLQFGKGFALVVVGLMAGFVFKCLALS